MGWFQKNEEESTRPQNPDVYYGLRLLAGGYVLYMLYQLFEMYFAGGEDAPSVTLLVIATVLLGGGGVFIVISACISWRKLKKELAQEALEQQDAEEEPEELPEAEDAEEE